MKFLCVLVVCAGLVGARGIDYDKIGQSVVRLIYKQAHKNVKVLETEPLPSTQDFVIVVVEEADTKYHIPLLADKSGDFVVGLTGVFFGTKQKDIALIGRVYEETQAFNFKQQNGAKIRAMLDSIPKDYVIDLESGNKHAKDLYIISDPSCPHCRKELANIHERLKDANVHMVLVAFLGQKSSLKAAHILKQIKQTPNTQSKIDLLQKVYATNYQVADVPDDKVQEVEKITQEIMGTKLVNGVPFIYEYTK